MKKVLVLFIALFCLVVGCTNTALKLLEPSNLLAGTHPEYFLSHSTYTDLKIEVISVTKGPSYSDQNFAVQILTPLLDKPNGITIVMDPQIDPTQVTNKSWSDQDLLNFEAKYAKLQTSGSTLVIHMLCVPGLYASDPQTNGVQEGPLVSAFFYDRIQNLEGNFSSAIFLHEIGHLFSLVNNGIPANHGHQDTVHGNHCNNLSCIMFDSPTGNQYDFCDYCKSDVVYFKATLK